MAEQYVDYVQTEVGRVLLARVFAGETLTFKRFGVGDGFDYDTANFPKRTELVNEVLSVENLTKEDVTDEKVIIKGSFSQSELEQEFYYREIGIYVVDPDDEDNELLLGYGNKNDKAELIVPSIGKYVVSKELKCFFTVGKASNINIYISENATASVINFIESDWTYDSNSETYSVYIGEVKESVNVFRIINGAKFPVPLSNITRTGNNETTIVALQPFDGCVVCI